MDTFFLLFLQSNIKFPSLELYVSLSESHLMYVLELTSKNIWTKISIYKAQFIGLNSEVEVSETDSQTDRQIILKIDRDS